MRKNRFGDASSILLRCPKFVARYHSPNFDRCHSFLLASSAPGGARKRPQLLTSRCVRWSTELFGGLLPLCSVCPIIIPNIPRKVKGGKWKNRRLGLFFMFFFMLFFSFFLPSLSFLPFLFVFLFVFFSAFICSVGSFDAMASPISSQLLTNRK